jgi:DNA polymerase-3 subunit beta
MKITVKKSVLLPKLAQLAKVVDDKNAVQIFSDILFSAEADGLHMVAGDGNICIYAYTDDLDMHRSGAATIPGKKLYEIVNKMGDTIELDSKNLKTKIKSGKSEHTLAGQDPEQYPTTPQHMVQPVSIKGEQFKALIKRTSYAVSTNQNTPILQGVKLIVRGSKLTATACDRHRLAQVSYDLQTGFTDALGVVNGDIFKKFTGIIEDNENVELFFESNRFFIKAADFTIALRVLDGSYPVTDKLVPESFGTEIVFKVKELQEALERALIIALDGKTNVLRMDAGLDIVITSESDGNTAVEEIAGTLTGSPLTISFNGKYMVDALKTIEAEKVTLCLNGVMDPMILRTDSADIQLVLPYRTRG